MSAAGDTQAIQNWLREKGPGDAFWPEPETIDSIELGEIETGLHIPDDFRDFILAGGLPDWFIVYTTWEILTLTYALKNYRDNLNLYGEESPLQNENKWRASWLPVVSNLGGDYLFLDLHQDGLFRYRHFDGNVEKLFEGFGDFIKEIREDVEQGNYACPTDEVPEYRGTAELANG